MINIKITVEIEGNTGSGKGIEQNNITEVMNKMGFVLSFDRESPARTVMVFTKAKDND